MRTARSVHKEKYNLVEMFCYFVNAVLCTGLVLFFAISAVVALAVGLATVTPSLASLIYLVPAVFFGAPLAGIIVLNRQMRGWTAKDKINGRVGQLGIVIGTALCFIFLGGLLMNVVVPFV